MEVTALLKNKNLLDRCFYCAGDIHGQLQGRVVLRLFQPHNGFAPHAHGAGQLLLCQPFGKAELLQPEGKVRLGSVLAFVKIFCGQVIVVIAVQ